MAGLEERYPLTQRASLYGSGKPVETEIPPLLVCLLEAQWTMREGSGPCQKEFSIRFL